MPIKRQKQPMQPAKNQRLVGVARETLQQLAGVARQTARAAIEASGYPVTIYNRLSHGRPCTCTNHDTSVLDSEGNLPKEQIADLLRAPSVKIKDYGSKPEAHQTGVDSNGTATYDVTPTPQKADPSYQSSFQEEYDDLSLEVEEEDLDLAELNADFETERLFARGNISCAVCYGTGFIGGFSLLNGTHQVLTVVEAHDLYNAEHDRQESPNLIRMFPSGTVEFTVTWPKGVTSGIVPMLFNNRELIDPTSYQLTIGGNHLTQSNLLDYAIGTPIVIKLTANKDLAFTHLDLAFRVSHTYADFPNVGVMYEIDKADPATPVSIVVPGDYNIVKGSIVFDHVMGISRAWRISSVTRYNDNYGVVKAWNAEARVLEKYELPALLRSLPFAEPSFRENRSV